MKVSMKMRIFFPFFERHSWDERLAVQPKQNCSEVPRIHGINLIKVLWQLRQKRVRHYAGEARSEERR